MTPLPRPAFPRTLLARTFLDKQLVDTEGHKVIRVNDIELVRNDAYNGGPELVTNRGPVHIHKQGFKGKVDAKGFAALAIRSLS